jgi:serine/threonine protein kinase
MEFVYRFCHVACARFLGYSLPAGPTSPIIAFFFEYFPRGFLYDFICRPRTDPPTNELSDTQRFIVIYGLAACITAAHQRGLFFGVVTPRHILMDENFEPHVFDCSFIRKDSIFSEELKDTIGNFLYEAPEETRDARSDIYSFGMILFRLTTDTVTFAGRFDPAKGGTAAIKSGRRPLVHKKVSPFLKSLIVQCWAQDPDRRPSAAQILKDLHKSQELVFPHIDAVKVEEYRRLVTSSLALNEPIWTIFNTSEELTDPPYLKQLSRKGNSELAAITSFQYLVFTGVPRDLDAFFSPISHSRFVRNPKYHCDLVSTFLMALRIRYQSSDSYVELFRRLQPALPRLLDLLLGGISRQLRLGDPYPREVSSLVFLSKLLSADLLSIPRLLSFVRPFARPGRQQAGRLLYCFFAPECETDTELFAALSPAIARRAQKFDWFDSIGRFLGDVGRVRAAGWKELIARRTRADTDGDLLAHLRRDDVEYVKACDLRAPAGDVFEPCVLLHSQPTLSMYAAAYGASRCFQFLWAAGAKMRDRDAKYTTVSHFAITGNCVAIMRFLLQNRIAFLGAPQVAAAFHRNHFFRHVIAARREWSLEAEDHTGKFPITAAAGANNVDLLCFLIGEGIDVNLGEGFGVTALHAAARAGQAQAVDILLRVEGVNPNLADIWGTTPLHIAVDCNQVHVVETMLRKKTVDINAKNGTGKTPLYLAARAGKTKIVRLFLAKPEIAVNECSKKGVCFSFSIRRFTLP